MEQPEGFIAKGEKFVCRLKKSLYGLKKAPRPRYKKFVPFMLDHNFKRLNEDHFVYIKRDERCNFIILLVYVDDMLIVGKYKIVINRLK